MQGGWRQAERLLRQTLASAGKLGDVHPDVARYRIGLARVLVALGDQTEAERLLRAGIPALAAKVGGDHPDVIQAQATLAEAGRAAVGRLSSATG